MRQAGWKHSGANRAGAWATPTHRAVDESRVGAVKPPRSRDLATGTNAGESGVAVLV
jgi:hypothetical protein